MPGMRRLRVRAVPPRRTQEELAMALVCAHCHGDVPEVQHWDRHIVQYPGHRVCAGCRRVICAYHEDCEETA